MKLWISTIPFHRTLIFEEAKGRLISLMLYVLGIKKTAHRQRLRWCARDNVLTTINKNIHHNHCKGKHIMKRVCFMFVIFGLPLFAATGFANAAKDNSAADIILAKILKAVENNDLGNFFAEGDNQFKLAVTKQMFDNMNATIAPRMKKGYKVVSLGTLNQQGYQLCLSKLVFKDGGDDILARLVLRNGKVAGVWFN
jgi:hypothetical protein